MSTNPTSGLTGDNTLNNPNTTYDNNTPNTTNEKGVLGGSSNSNPSTGGVLGSTGGVMSGSNTVGSNSADASYAPAPTLNPHDEERARVVAERAMGSTSTSTTGAGVGGLESGVGHHGSGVGSGVGLGSGAGVGSGVGSGVGLGSGHESAHHGSGVGSGVGLGSGAGLASGVGSDRHASGVGSGVGLDSDRHGSGVGSGVGLDSARHGSGVGSGVGLDKSASNVDPPSEERHGSTSGQDSHKPPVTGPSKGSLENKSAIPTAGGVKLGEKHWGESDFVPEFPKKSEEKVSSSSGQPDQSTRDNTAANKGDSSTIPPTGAGEHGEQKEGMMDKVKHTLHMGGSK